MTQDIAKIEQLAGDRFGQEWEIGISTLTYPHDPVKAIEEFVEAGVSIHHIELALGRRVKFGGYIETLLEQKERYDLKFSVHVPFLYDDLAHPHPEIRKVNLSEAQKAIELANRLGASWVVVHPGHLFLEDSLPPVDALEPLQETREFYLENASSSITELADYLPRQDIELRIENLPSLGKNKKEIRQLIPNNSRTLFLMDLGHANIPETTSNLLTLEPDHFHLHDNGGKEDRHMKLGAGNIDFSKIFKTISTYGDKKVIILELYRLSDVKESLEYFVEILEEMDRE
ncbi:sugar phosphate isomerase/epimerase [Candidatus Bipolaricaulota bacterium]|nr:sugar phosphate isomerase/epimerase [Candidatus Bipolaricaulota bacterium]